MPLGNPIRGLLVAAACAAWIPGSLEAADAPWRDRARFVRRLAAVRASGAAIFGPDEAARYEREGMSRAEVLAILGPPDDIVTARDFTSRLQTDAPDEELWCYGTNGHLTLPTLGTVELSDGQARIVTGAKGRPPRAGLFSEAELRRLLRLIDQVPSPADGDRWDPLAAIRAVNTLQPLGRARALAALGEYGRVTAPDMSPADEDAVDWETFSLRGAGGVLDLLFSLRDRRKERIGETSRLVVQDGIPLQPHVTQGQSGLVPSINAKMIDAFAKLGTFRRQPLRPTAHPLRVLERVQASPAWRGLAMRGGEENRRLVMGQLLLLLAPVYGKQEDPDRRSPGPVSNLDARWQELSAWDAKVTLRWDERRKSYIAASPRPEVRKNSRTRH